MVEQNEIKRQTWQQTERQKARAANGKYKILNPCEFCGKSAGANYASLENCNETGIGVCVCDRKECRANPARIAQGRVRRLKLSGEEIDALKYVLSDCVACYCGIMEKKGMNDTALYQAWQKIKAAAQAAPSQEVA